MELRKVHKYCDGKRIYDKKGAITAKNKRWNEDRVKLRLYPHKNHWHLTKQLRAKKVVKKKKKISFREKVRYKKNLYEDC